MHIEHIAIYVHDLEAEREFYCRYFGGTSNAKYTNPDKGFSSYFISFAGGARLELMHNDAVANSPQPQTTGWHHISISTGDKKSVDELVDRLVTDGYELTGGPRTTGDGYYEATIVDPEGNTVEITV